MVNCGERTTDWNLGAWRKMFAAIWMAGLMCSLGVFGRVSPSELAGKLGHQLNQDEFDEK